MSRSRRTTFAASALGAALLAAAAIAAPAPRGTGLAVMEFRIASTARAGYDLGTDLQDSLHSALTPALRGKPVSLIERVRLKDVLQENSKSDTGIIDPAEAVKVGGKAGARYVLLGTITSVDSVLETEARSLEKKYGIRLPQEAQGLLDKIKLPNLFRSRNNNREEPDYISLITVEARIVSISKADGEASFKVQGMHRGKRENYGEAVSDAAANLAKLIGASIQRDGRVVQPRVDTSKGKGGDPGTKPDVEPETPVETMKREGRILDAEDAEEIAVKLDKDHGLRTGTRLRMRWVVPVAGDNTVRKTKVEYRVEVVETDTGGVLVKVLSVEKGNGLPEKDDMVILEPDKK